MPLAEQLVHQRCVHPGPLVLRTGLLKFPTPATDRDRTVPQDEISHTQVVRPLEDDEVDRAEVEVW